MSTRPFLFALVLVTAAFAGCAADEGGEPGTDTTPTGGSPTPASPTPTTPAGDGLTTVVVGTEAAYPPFEDQTAEGEVFGFDIDVMREIGNRSGFTPQFQHAQFTAIIPSVQSGQFDAGISAFTITDERKEQVDFSISYYDNELMVAVRSDNTDITQESDLADKRVCTQTGTTSWEWLRDHGHDNESMLLLESFPPCADALKRGDVDAMMIDRAVVRELITNSNGELKEAFVIPTDEQFGIAVQKGNTVLLTRINTALQSMKQDGTLDELKDKWQV